MRAIVRRKFDILLFIYHVIMIATRCQMIRKISDITVKIIHCFSSERQTPRLSDDCYIDIELLEKAENLYHIHVTNYNRRNVYLQNNSITTFQTICSKFSSLIPSDPMAKNYLRTILLVTKEGEYETEQIYHFELVDDSSFSISHEEILNYLMEKKNYLSARLECNMLSTNIFMFKNSVMEELEKLDTLDNKLRYVFRSGDKIFWRNKFQVQRAFASCRRVSLAVNTVLKNSQSHSFREQCLRIIGSFENSDSGDPILEQLLSLICQKYHKVGEEG